MNILYILDPMYFLLVLALEIQALDYEFVMQVRETASTLYFEV
jgi:hypothetical protein